MLRSAIAYVFFLFVAAAISLAGTHSAQAEMPSEAWLNVAVDSLDQQIGQQMELTWQTWHRLGQSAAINFERLMDQCRLGMGGKRGLQLVRVVDLLVELRHSGVRGTFTLARNWNFPAENFELQSSKIVRGDVQCSQSAGSKAAESPVVRIFFKPLTHVSSAQRSLLNAMAKLAAQVNEQIDRLEKEVYRPAKPLMRSISQTWEKLTVSPDNHNRDETFCRRDDRSSAKNSPSKAWAAFEIAGITRFWQEVSNFAQAKLNWLTSKVRHIAEACLKSIEPQLLTLELVPLA